MAGGNLPPEVSALIAKHIDSVVRLEVLLHLYRRAPASDTADGTAKELRVDAAWASGQLDELCARGLAECEDGPPKTYRYAPISPQMGAAVDMLAVAFAQRRVAVIATIYSQPPDPLRTFSDAFKLRKDRGGENG